MKIVLVETDSRGGLIHFAYQLADALAGQGADVTLITAEDYELRDLPHRFRVLPILRLWQTLEAPARTRLGAVLRRRLWPLRRAGRALVLTREWARLTRTVRGLGPDVVLFSSIRFRFLSVFLRMIARDGTQLAQICHEFANREAGGGAMGKLMGTLFPRPYAAFSTIFLFSEAAGRDFCRLFPEEAAKARVLPHGPELLFGETYADRAQLTGRYHLTPGERLVLMFGGLRPSKGVEDLVEAFGRIPDRQNLRLLIAGYPSREFDREGLEQRIARLGLGAQVTLDYRYLGLSELGTLIRRADVVAFPYRSATSSGALALAMSLGRPVVATAVGGLADAVEDGVTGRLAAPGDADNLACAISSLLGDPAAAARMAEHAREVMLTERSWDAIAARMLRGLAADRDAGDVQIARRDPPLQHQT